MISARIRYARMKSILEVPISNEKFWSKVPSAPADAIMMDLEDSATPDNKVVVREKILDALKRPDYFGGRQIIIRVNNPRAHRLISQIAQLISMQRLAN